MRSLFAFWVFLSFLLPLGAQQDFKEKLALQYFQEGKYEFAADLYEELANKDVQSVNYYEKLLQCYVQLNQSDKGLSLIKKRKKKFPDNPAFSVDEAWLYTKQNKDKDASEVLSKIIKQAPEKSGYYLQLANAMEKRGFQNEALQVLELAENKWPADALDFSNQVAGMYLKMGKREKGIEKYLEMITNSYMFYGFEQVKNVLEMNLTDSADFMLLRNLCIKKIQKNAGNDNLNLLLRWSYIRLKDWNSAFIQTRALDKKLNEKGNRVMDLGELCMSNEAWEAATRCFEYVQSLGKQNTNYIAATAGMLETKYRLWQFTFPTAADKMQLTAAFQNFIDEHGKNDFTWKSVSRLAQIYLEYNQNADSAIDLLQSFVDEPGISAKTAALAKLQLGDALIITDDVWTSELLYAQVEKDFPEESIAQEAKYRRARLSYYRGDFDWAQDQLSVLKSATTQTISNNAIRLSLLITENLGIDSNYDAMERFSNAELLLLQNKNREAEKELDSIMTLYPGHSLSDDILYLKGQVREKENDFKGALEMYDKAAIAFNFDILADNSWYRMGMIYMQKLNDKGNAKKCFEKIVLDFPGSLFQMDARRYVRILRGDNI